MVAIQPITIQRLDTFKAVRLRALLDTPSAFGSTYAREAAMTDSEWALRVERWSGERGIGFLAIEAGEPCGIAGVLVDEMQTTRGQLVSMWVDPACRQRGVGRTLVRAVFAWAERAGLRRLDLFVTSNNQRAARFYEGLGFAMTGQSIPYVNDPALLEREMTRAIPESGDSSPAAALAGANHQSPVNSASAPLTPEEPGVRVTLMENLDFDQLLATYKQAVDQWVAAIRAEEALANADHSIVEMEKWDSAALNVGEAQKAAEEARDAYRDALRQKNYGF